MRSISRGYRWRYSSESYPAAPVGSELLSRLFPCLLPRTSSVALIDFSTSGAMYFMVHLVVTEFPRNASPVEKQASTRIFYRPMVLERDLRMHRILFAFSSRALAESPASGALPFRCLKTHRSRPWQIAISLQAQTDIPPYAKN